MKNILRWFFFRVIVRFIVLIIIGINIRHRERLPQKGPAIIVANHNSHLDTLVLISLLSPKLLSKVQPVAAMDYFLANRALAWFARNIMGTLLVNRKAPTPGGNVLLPCYEALKKEGILIFFPEGTRGEPETMSTLKKGITHIAKDHPAIPVIPIFLHGLGKSMPKNEALLVPFFCDVFVGEPLVWTDDKYQYLAQLKEAFKTLSAEGSFASWS